MSTFAVTIERIADIWEHTNADRLEMAKLASMSYQFVIAKGPYKPGDLVVYFPIDSLIPQPVIEAIGLTGKLSGSEALRREYQRLRGELDAAHLASPLPEIPTTRGALNDLLIRLRLGKVVAEQTVA